MDLLTVFEHEKVFVSKGNKRLPIKMYEALVAFHGEKTPFFKLLRDGVEFNHHVGVLQVGSHLIQVLPKADEGGEEKWQNNLVNMVRTVWGFPVKESGSSALRLKNNTLLDLYFELFVSEVEGIMHQGLVKKYNRVVANSSALKGKLMLTAHLRKNVVHKERFFIAYHQYSIDHVLHDIIYTTLIVLDQVSTNTPLKSRITNLLLYFSERNKVKPTSGLFRRIEYNRKTQPYRKAMEIAELILLNYHPDVKKGRNNVLALMFDMNDLWERFVFVVLRKGLPNYTLSSTATTKFWRSADGRDISVYPDIFMIAKEAGPRIILDTKWKNLNGKSPSVADIRQMYVYHKYFDATKVALIYPGNYSIQSGVFYDVNRGDSAEESSTNHEKVKVRECSVVQIPAGENFQSWRENIVGQVESFLDDNRI